MLSYPGALLDVLLGLTGLLLLAAPLLSPRPMKGPFAAMFIALGWAGVGRLLVALELPLPSVLASLLGVLAGLAVAWQLWSALVSTEAGSTAALLLLFLPILALCVASPLADAQLVDAALLDRPGLIDQLLDPSAELPSHRLMDIDAGRVDLGHEAPPFRLIDAHCGAVVAWQDQAVGRRGLTRSLGQRRVYTRLGDSSAFIQGTCEGPMDRALVPVPAALMLSARSGVPEPVALYPAPSAEALSQQLDATRAVHAALPLVVLLWVGVAAARRRG